MNSEHNGEPETATQPNANPEDRHDPVDEGGKVDRIRDILFGSQMRDYDERFQRLDERLTREAMEARAEVQTRLEALDERFQRFDERLTREAMEARAEVQTRLEALESFFKGEVESMTNRFNTEQSERGNALEIARNLASMVNALEAKISGIGEETARELHALREQLSEQSKALSAEINEKHNQIKAGLDREAEQIRGTMIGREPLAEILSEVAHRLKNGFRAPGA
jgi:archaellum component FlaC